MKNSIVLSIIFSLIIVNSSLGQQYFNSNVDTVFKHYNDFTYTFTDTFSSNLPIVMIDTDSQKIPDEPKLDAFMGIIFNGDSARNYITDPFNEYEGNIGIETRGWSSRKFPKKQYQIETRDEFGENLNVPLFGMPAENDWVLNAPYSDKTFMRNTLTYYLSTKIGRYASRTRFCELFLNNEYLGIYVVIEKIKRDKNRVNISKLEADDIAGDDLTGGYIIKIDKFYENRGDSVWVSAYPTNYQAVNRIHYQYCYPKNTEIVSQQKQYIQNFIYEFETLAFNDEHDTPLSEYEKYIDVGSFVDFLISNELGKNIDGYRLSTYFHKDKNSVDSKLKMGPLWDFNLAFCNASYNTGYLVKGWMVDYLDMRGNGKYWLPFWWQKLLWNEEFIEQIKTRWFDLRENIINTNSLFAYIDSVTTYLDEAQKRNFEKWDILGEYVWPNPKGYNNRVTYNDEIEYLKQWLIDRIQWMDDNIPSGFSKVIWADKNIINSTQLVGVEKAISINDITLKTVVVDSVIFLTDYPDLQIIYDGDSVRITGFRPLKYRYNGYALSNGDTVSVSPDYMFDTYSDKIVWNNPESVNFTGIVNVETVIPNSEIIFKHENLDSIIFTSDYSKLEIVQTADTLYLKALTDSVFEFYGIAWRGGYVESISPNYQYICNVSKVSDYTNKLPEKFSLLQNYPNPFNSTTTINYTLSENADVKLIIYNINGQEVTTLIDSRQSAGYKSIKWDVTNHYKENLSSNIYIFRLQVDNQIFNRKMLFLK